MYSSIERSNENITLCEYCLREYKKYLTNIDLLVIYEKSGEALIENG